MHQSERTHLTACAFNTLVQKRDRKREREREREREGERERCNKWILSAWWQRITEECFGRQQMAPVGLVATDHGRMLWAATNGSCPLGGNGSRKNAPDNNKWLLSSWWQRITEECSMKLCAPFYPLSPFPFPSHVPIQTLSKMKVLTFVKISISLKVLSS